MSWDYDHRRAHSSTASSLMSLIISYQERGALLSEIASALHKPIEEIRRAVMEWLRLK